MTVADCKLATRDDMGHIHRNRGRFLSVLPAPRKEDAAFRHWVSDHDPAWTEAARRPGRRQGDPDEIRHTVEAPWPSVEGHRVIWVHSAAKIDYDADARADRIARGIAALDELNQRLASPKTRMKTTVAVEQAATAALDRTGAARWIRVSVDERVQQRFRQEKRGRPGADTRYRRRTRTHHRVAYTVDEKQVAHDAASDGCFPLISNDRDLSGAELLTAYKYQPNLEKRHAQLKGTQLVAPIFLHDPARIEGLLCCHFIAMLVQALIERQIRAAMKTHGMKQLSIYPEDRGCAALTAARILEIFTGLARHHLTDQHGHHCADLPAPTHRATSTGPRPARDPPQRLHSLTPWGSQKAVQKCGKRVATQSKPQPERCWPLAVGVVWWTGMPRRRGGRVGEPELRHRRVVLGG